MQVIEIKYHEGQITIHPDCFYVDMGITAFRKLIKLSVKSDLIYGTDAIGKWRNTLYNAINDLKNTKNPTKAEERRKGKLEKFKQILEKYTGKENKS